MSNGCLYKLIVVGPVVTVKKPDRFLRGFFKQLWESNQENAAEGHRFWISIAAAVSTGLPFRRFLSFLLLFSFFVEIALPISASNSIGERYSRAEWRRCWLYTSSM